MKKRKDLFRLILSKIAEVGLLSTKIEELKRLWMENYFGYFEALIQNVFDK